MVWLFAIANADFNAPGEACVLYVRANKLVSCATTSVSQPQTRVLSMLAVPSLRQLDYLRRDWRPRAVVDCCSAFLS